VCLCFVSLSRPFSVSLSFLTFFHFFSLIQIITASEGTPKIVCSYGTTFQMDHEAKSALLNFITLNGIREPHVPPTEKYLEDVKLSSKIVLYQGRPLKRNLSATCSLKIMVRAKMKALFKGRQPGYKDPLMRPDGFPVEWKDPQHWNLVTNRCFIHFERSFQSQLRQVSDWIDMKRPEGDVK
jgi:hypothetical protein